MQTKQPLGPQGWLTTFNDLMTLLMVFFVLLFALSRVDVEKFALAFADLQSGTGVLEGGRQTAVGISRGDDLVVRADNTEEAADPLVQALAQEPEIGADELPQGIAITLGSQILFDTGVARLDPQGLPVLAKVAQVLKERDGLIRIAGHTDDRPIQTPQYPSNWELSAARAVNVLKYFINPGGIDPRRLAAVGYGSAKPLGPNVTAEERARNRRVEIVLVKEGS